MDERRLPASLNVSLSTAYDADPSGSRTRRTTARSIFSRFRALCTRLASTESRRHSIAKSSCSRATRLMSSSSGGRSVRRKPMSPISCGRQRPSARPDEAQRAIGSFPSEHRHILPFKGARLYEERGDFVPPPFGHVADIFECIETMGALGHGDDPIVALPSVLCRTIL